MRGGKNTSFRGHLEGGNKAVASEEENISPDVVGSRKRFRVKGGLKEEEKIKKGETQQKISVRRATQEGGEGTGNRNWHAVGSCLLQNYKP